MLTAQVKIKEKVEITGKPKTLQMRETSSNSSIPYFEIVKMPQAYDQMTQIRVNIPSQCTITGSYSAEQYTCYGLAMDGYSFPQEAFNTYACQILDIGPVTGCECGCFIDLTPTISVAPTSISVSINATWCCVEPNHVQANWDFTITAEPVSALLNLDVHPAYLDANDYGSHEANINAILLNGSGNPFGICWLYEPQPTMTFTIEPPLNGMTLRGNASDGASIVGTSIEVPQWSGASNVFFVWDGSDIPKEIDTVSIRAECMGALDTQKIELKKIIPHHFTVTPDANPIYAGESVNVRAIAKNINDEVAALDGGKSITFSDESGIGSFIVGSDTIPSQAIVTYDQAKSDSIKYYSKLDTSNLVDEQYVWLCAALTEHPERNGYGYLEVMPACLIVSASPSKISPGNKTTVSVMAQTAKGVFPYPSDQSFIASMDADARYGKLRCISTGDEGTSISGPQRFEFIAANSIDVDSIVVNISVSPGSNGGGGGGGTANAIKNGQKDTLQSQAGLMLGKQTKLIGKEVVSIKDGTKNVLISQQEAIKKKLTEQNNVFVQKAAKKQMLMKAITEAIKTQAAKKGDAASAKQLNAMVQALAEGASCKESASVTIENDGCGNPPCGDPPTANPLLPRDVSNRVSPPKGVCDLQSTLGWTTPLNGGEIVFQNNTLNNLFSVQVCANRNEKQWKFNLTTVGFLYQTGICESHLTGKTDIGDGRGPNVNAANYCKILEWLSDINPITNQPNAGNYYSSNILQLHESFHLDNLVFRFKTKYLQTFINSVNSSSVPITDCSESVQSVIDRNKNKLEEDFKKLMKAFVESIDDVYMKDDEAKVQKDTKTYFEGLASIISARAINESWPTCK
jgi:hypothetical protein